MDAFTENEKREFIRVIQKIKENDFYFPDEEIMRTVHGMVSMWAPELVIINQGTILLARYQDGVKEFRGHWHIPGGYNKWPESDIQETCSRVARRELRVDVEYIKTLDSYKWKTGEHPYGHPLSLYVRCFTIGKVTESESLRFFPRFSLPDNLLKPHREFLNKYLVAL